MTERTPTSKQQQQQLFAWKPRATREPEIRYVKGGGSKRSSSYTTGRPSKQTIEELLANILERLTAIQAGEDIVGQVAGLVEAGQQTPLYGEEEPYTIAMMREEMEMIKRQLKKIKGAEESYDTLQKTNSNLRETLNTLLKNVRQGTGTAGADLSVHLKNLRLELNKEFSAQLEKERKEFDKQLTASQKRQQEIFQQLELERQRRESEQMKLRQYAALAERGIVATEEAPTIVGRKEMDYFPILRRQFKDRGLTFDLEGFKKWWESQLKQYATLMSEDEKQCIRRFVKISVVVERIANLYEGKQDFIEFMEKRRGDLPDIATFLRDNPKFLEEWKESRKQSREWKALLLRRNTFYASRFMRAVDLNQREVIKEFCTKGGETSEGEKIGAMETYTKPDGCRLFWGQMSRAEKRILKFVNEQQPELLKKRAVTTAWEAYQKTEGATVESLEALFKGLSVT